MDLSFIVPCLNSEKSIQQTLDSIFRQQTTFSFEVIVVDNGSSDNTLTLARAYPVKIFSEERIGANHARNLGIKNAQGDYLAFIDSDVVLDSTWAQELLTYVKNKNLKGAQGQIIRQPFKDELNLLEKFRCMDTGHPTRWIDLATEEYFVGCINTAACIYEAETLKNVKNFSEVFRIHEDYDLTLKVRTLPEASIGCTRQAIAHCYYTKGVFSYINRSFSHGFYFAFIEKKWKLKRLQESSRPKNIAISLTLLMGILKLSHQLGKNVGKLYLSIRKPIELEIEAKRAGKIARLPKTKEFKAYFEDKELRVS